MAEITVAADLDSLNDVLAFVDGEMERAGCSMKLMTQVDMAVEEIFVNIARYAYHPEAGEASVRCEAGGDPFQIVLGILMAKKLMDDIQYEYRDGKNILTLRKNG